MTRLVLCLEFVLLHLRGAIATKSALQWSQLHLDIALYCILRTAAVGNTLRGVGWLGGDQGQGERRCECYTVPVVQEVHCTALLVQEEAGGKVSATANQWCMRLEV